MKPSARIVLEMISRPDGACLWDFGAAHIGRFGARIFELRKLGYGVEASKCGRHPHRQYIETYRLVSAPESNGQVALTLQEVPS